MEVTATKITGLDLAQRACQFTLHSQKATSIGLEKIYRSEHSPMRTQLFWIEMKDIPSFVSVHLVRHHVGVDHFVQTQRTDRGAEEVANRLTPVNHAMLINAQALVNMARKRLCNMASVETQIVMAKIRGAIRKVDPELVKCMQPECIYRGGVCHELSGCGSGPGE